MGTLCFTPTNFVATCHVKKDKDDVRGNFSYGFSVPGQLSVDLASAFSEVYYMKVEQEEHGTRRVFVTQSNPDQFGVIYPAQTHIKAPDLCNADYDSIWS